MSVDILAFGPHPDDLEIGLGAALATHVDGGWRVGLCDLTRGELGSNGTAEERVAEAAAAADVLGVAWRENLGWPDGGIDGGDGQLRGAVDLIRRHRPAVVAIPHARDRHPDHAAASRVLTDAVFRSGLRRYAGGAPWRPDWVCYYFINDVTTPSFVLDVSAAYDRKRQALACYRSQFAPTDADAVPTRLTATSFLRMIEARDAHAGALAGVAFAEGVAVTETLTRPTLLKHWTATPPSRPGSA